MSFELKHCISNNSNCSQICVTDTTGAYSVSNPTGWNPSLAPLLASATAATITISKRKADGSFTSAPIPTLSVFNTLPSNVNAQKCLTAEQFGYGVNSVFADGIYKSVYNVINTGGGAYNVSSTIYFTVTCSIDCCIQTVAHKASICVCDCSGLNQSLADLQLNRRLLQAAIRTGNLDDIQNFIDKLSKSCQTCGCGCN